MGELEIVIKILLASVVIVTLFKSLKLSPVLGYFVAGAAVGEFGFNVLTPGYGVHLFAEFGIVFLLFVIGIELTLDKLIAMRKHVFGFGSLQIILTASALGYASHVFFGTNPKVSLIIGSALAFSSTAIVLQVMRESGIQSSAVGRLSVATLLMQDFAVVPMLVLIPLLSHPADSVSLLYSLGTALFKAMITLIAIFVVGKVIIRPIFGLMTNLGSSELFTSTTLLIILSAAYITESMQLSLALGAFVAGLLVAETEYRHEVEVIVNPFKSLLLGLFFMTVGMSINLNTVHQNAAKVVLISLVIIIIKGLVIYGLSLAFGFRQRHAMHAALLLCQGSEFAFILFNLSRDSRVLDLHQSEILMMCVTLTMALTPALAALGAYISQKLEENEAEDCYIRSEMLEMSRHAIVIGFGNAGKTVVNVLEHERVPCVVMDIHQTNVTRAWNDGFLAIKADALEEEPYRLLNVQKALSLIITVRNEILVRKITKMVKKINPSIRVVARLDNLSKLDTLKSIGVDDFVPQSHEAGLQMAERILLFMDYSAFEVQSLKNSFRSNNYCGPDVIADKKRQDEGERGLITAEDGGL